MEETKCRQFCWTPCISNHVHCCCGASARTRHHLHLSLSTFPPDWQLILQTNTAANKSFSDLEWNASLILTRSVLLHSTSDMIYHFNLSNGINLRSFISPLNVTITLPAACWLLGRGLLSVRMAS